MKKILRGVTVLLVTVAMVLQLSACGMFYFDFDVDFETELQTDEASDSGTEPQTDETSDSDAATTDTTEGETAGECESFTQLCDDLFRDMISSSAYNAHFSVTDESEYGIAFTEEDYSLGEFYYDSQEDFDYYGEYRKRLLAISRDGLSSTEKRTYDILLEYLNIKLDYEDCYKVENLFDPRNGIVSSLSWDFIEYVFYDKEDIDEYLLFLKSAAAYVSSALDYASEQIKDGYFMCDEIIDANIEQIDKYLSAQTDPLIVTFEEKTDEMDSLTDEEKEEYKALNEEYVNTYYLPVYSKIREFLLEHKGAGTNEGGLCGFGEEGKAYYEALIKDKTSCNMTAGELINYLDDAMDSVFLQIVEIANNDYDSYEESFDYDTGISSPDDVMEYALEKMSADFPEPVTRNYSLKYQNEACEVDGNTAYYVLCRIDDISVNNIKINGSSVGDSSISLYSALTHEGYPGHLYQYTYFYSNDEIPDVIKMLDLLGSTEGWAEYASYCTLDYLDCAENVKKMIYLNDIFSYILVSRVDAGVNYEG